MRKQTSYGMGKTGLPSPRRCWRLHGCSQRGFRYGGPRRLRLRRRAARRRRKDAKLGSAAMVNQLGIRRATVSRLPSMTTAYGPGHRPSMGTDRQPAPVLGRGNGMRGAGK